MTLVKTDLGFLHIIQKFKIVGRETNNNKGQFILNETKYGATNLLRKNQKVIQDAIKAGKEIEIRSIQGIRDSAGTLVKSQGQTIKVTKIIRSNIFRFCLS